jgi:hypothetical protein
MRSALLRNLIGVVVAVAAATAIVVADLYPEWSSYRHTIAPQHVIAAGASSSVYGQTWRLGSVRRIADFSDGLLGPAPSGTVLTVVSIDRSGSPTMTECTGVITDGRRRWRVQGLSGFTAPLVAGATPYCSKPGALQFSFLMPSSVAPRAVDITAANEAILLRIML